jgi:hypothetical protein
MLSLSRSMYLAVCFGLSCWWQSAGAEEVMSAIKIDDDIEIEVLHIGNQTETAVIWFACNQGDETAEFAAARQMVELGYQFYFPDMLSAHFLSPTPSNIARVPPEEIEAVVLQLLQDTSASRVFLIGGARAAVPVLKGLARDNIKAQRDKLRGALLITPRINQQRPEPGAEPVYIDAVGQSLHPIRVLEGERTPNRWGLPFLKQSLAKSGSPVTTDLIKGVRGFFYLRGDKTPEEADMTVQLPLIIHQNLQELGVSP